MAAKTGTDVRKNYYSVSYGKLSTRVKDKPAGEEVTEAELKSKISNVENIDLRDRYLIKTGDYPYQIFFDNIVGDVTSVEKKEFDKGVSLNISMTDTDGDLSIIQSKFYSKYTENVLNRIMALPDLFDLSLFPYSIPSEYEGNHFYNQGILIRKNGEKVMGHFSQKDNLLPPTERITGSDGKETTSRVKRINFLYEQVREKFFKFSNTAPTNPNAKVVEPKQEAVKKADLPLENPFEGEEDELPF